MLIEVFQFRVFDDLIDILKNEPDHQRRGDVQHQHGDERPPGVVQRDVKGNLIAKTVGHIVADSNRRDPSDLPHQAFSVAAPRGERQDREHENIIDLHRLVPLLSQRITAWKSPRRQL